MILFEYNPKKYWEERGKVYRDQFQNSDFFKKQESFLLEQLKTLNFNSILEFGCGFGRITKLILSNFDIQEYKAIDLSIDQIDNAKQELGELANKVDFQVCNLNETSFKSSHYDLVLGVEVLMHVKPSDIEKVITHLLNSSKKYFINVDYYAKPVPKLAPHNFVHEYSKIFKKISSTLIINELPIGTSQTLFHVTKS